MFSADAPSADATVLVREVIQNSWDAAITMEAAEAPEFLTAKRRARILGALVGVEAVTAAASRRTHPRVA